MGPYPYSYGVLLAEVAMAMEGLVVTELPGSFVDGGSGSSDEGGSDEAGYVKVDFDALRQRLWQGTPADGGHERTLSLLRLAEWCSAHESTMRPESAKVHTLMRAICDNVEGQRQRHAQPEPRPPIRPLDRVDAIAAPAVSRSAAATRQRKRTLTAEISALRVSLGV